MQVLSCATEKPSMNLIHSKQEIRLAVPSSIVNPQDADAWLASMSDSGWRVLTDFQNWPNWMPGVRSVEQADSEPPARGTDLQVNRGHKTTIFSIDCWDPPRTLQLSINLAHGEMAYGSGLKLAPRTRKYVFLWN